MDQRDVEIMKRVAIIQARVVACYADIEAMKAENEDRKRRGESPAYSEKSFADIALFHGVCHNDVYSLLSM